MRSARSVFLRANRRPSQKRGFKTVNDAADEPDELEKLATLLQRNVQILKD